ncbi:MAG: hypothetical protein AB7F22_14170 [Reyranella sp.]|uniref:hypothetical protein n=1 Tax=Reyranella sp. TaxID=1929291 RepID=UPI003D146D73
MAMTPEQKYLADLDRRTERARRSWLELAATRTRLLSSGSPEAALDVLLEIESVQDAERRYRSLQAECREAHAQFARVQRSGIK